MKKKPIGPVFFEAYRAQFRSAGALTDSSAPGTVQAPPQGVPSGALSGPFQKTASGQHAAGRPIRFLLSSIRGKTVSFSSETVALLLLVLLASLFAAFALGMLYGQSAAQEDLEAPTPSTSAP